MCQVLVRQEPSLTRIRKRESTESRAVADHFKDVLKRRQKHDVWIYGTDHQRNLSNGSITKEPLNMKSVQDFVGARGFGELKYFCDRGGSRGQTRLDRTTN